MNARTGNRFALVVLTIMLLTAVSWAQDKLPVPEFFGFYAVDGGRSVALYEGQGSAARQRNAQIYSVPQNGTIAGPVAELTSSARFILFYTTAGEMVQTMTLHRLPQLRNVVEQADPAQRIYGARDKVASSPNEPVLARIPEQAFRLLSKPIPGQVQMIELVPNPQLTPGMYVLDYEPTGKPGWYAVFAVGSPEASSGNACIDLFLPGGYGGMFWRANSELSNAVPALSSERYKPCGGDGSAGSKTIPAATNPVPVSGNNAASTSAICTDYDGCMRVGFDAFKSSSWDQALTSFTAAARYRQSGLPWMWVGNTQLAMGNLQDFSSAWDKALNLQFTLAIAACRERGIQQCDLGVLHLSNKTVSFLSNGQTVFEQPLGQVNVGGAVAHNFAGYVSFGLEASSKKYNFDLIPNGIDCPQSAHVNCSRAGMAQQTAIGNYISQAIPKLLAGTLGGGAPGK